MRERTGSIWPSVVLHATANTVAVILVAHIGCS
jgi:membrane protease YdiL (CAAX protease family)